MTDEHWKERFIAELTRLNVPGQVEHLSMMAHQFWLSSSGVEPEAIALAVAEAWPGGSARSDRDQVVESQRQIEATRHVLLRLEHERHANDLRLLDSHAALCRARPCVTGEPIDGFESIVHGWPRPPILRSLDEPKVDPHVQ